jgi:hypothetical protein
VFFKEFLLQPKWPSFKGRFKKNKNLNGGDRPSDGLVKSGYESNMKIFLFSLLNFWLFIGTKYKNLAIYYYYYPPDCED